MLATSRITASASTPIPPPVVVLPDISHLDTERGWIRRAVGQHAPLEDLEQNRSLDAANPDFDPVCTGDRQPEHIERIVHFRHHITPILIHQTGLVHEVQECARNAVIIAARQQYRRRIVHVVVEAGNTAVRVDKSGRRTIQVVGIDRAGVLIEAEQIGIGRELSGSPTALIRAGRRHSKRLYPTCIRPVINSMGRRPLVTYQGENGFAVGSLISMRLLSKYCTTRIPSYPSSNGSRSAGVLGAGPQVYDRPLICSATGRSWRSQTRRNASLPKGGAEAETGIAAVSIAIISRGARNTMRRIVASFLRVVALCAGGYQMRREAGEAMFEVQRN